MINVFKLIAENDVTIRVEYLNHFDGIAVTFTKYSAKEGKDLHYRITYSMDSLAEHLFVELDIKEHLCKFLNDDRFVVMENVHPVQFVDAESDPIAETLAKPGRVATHYYVDYGCGIAVFVTPDENMVIPRFIHRANEIGLQIGRLNVLKRVQCPISDSIYEYMEENGQVHYWEDEN